MSCGETFVLVDIRTMAEYQNWLLKGQTLSAINVPFYDAREREVNQSLMPQTACVVLVQTDSPSAEKMARLLADKGYEVATLATRDVWTELYTQATIVESAAFTLTQFHRLATGCLSYVLVTAKQALVVDPTRHVNLYLDCVEREHARITHVIDTHVHGDHISGARALLRETSATYHVAHSELRQHELDVKVLSKGTLRIGAVELHTIILDTEGETQGNSLFEVNGRVLFSGNAIAVGEVGIPDLQGNAREWAEKLFNTVLRDIQYLSDETLVLPAHFAAIQAVNSGGYVGALLGDLRLGAQAMAMNKTTTMSFSRHPGHFVSTLPKVSDQIRLINAGLGSLDGFNAADLEDGARE